MPDLDRIMIDCLVWLARYFNLPPAILDLYVGMLVYCVLLVALYAGLTAYYRHRDSSTPR